MQAGISSRWRLCWIGAALSLSLFGCGPAPSSGQSAPGGQAPPAEAAAASPFQGERAFADLRDQVALGPRPVGSAAAQRTRELIRTRMRAAGWKTEDHVFSVPGPDGEPVEMVNLVSTLPGALEETLMFGAHYDTKRFDQRFVGANDGASGVAVLLELARWLGREQPRLTVQMFFFDGEEAFGPSITAVDGLYGSQALAQKLQGEGALQRARALILVDMVGDRDLNIGVDRNSSAELRAMAQQVAPELIDPRQTLDLIDDHIPFLQRGLRSVLALIDFQFGSRQSPGPLWHTPDDDLSSVSAESLQRVGDLLVGLVERLEVLSAAGARGETPGPAAG